MDIQTWGTIAFLVVLAVLTALHIKYPGPSVLIERRILKDMQATVDQAKEDWKATQTREERTKAWVDGGCVGIEPSADDLSETG